MRRCDRILFRAGRGADASTVRCLRYGRHEIALSDHRPVSADLELGVAVPEEVPPRRGIGRERSGCGSAVPAAGTRSGSPTTVRSRRSWTSPCRRRCPPLAAAAAVAVFVVHTQERRLAVLSEIGRFHTQFTPPPSLPSRIHLHHRHPFTPPPSLRSTSMHRNGGSPSAPRSAAPSMRGRTRACRMPSKPLVHTSTLHTSIHRNGGSQSAPRYVELWKRGRTSASHSHPPTPPSTPMHTLSIPLPGTTSRGPLRDLSNSGRVGERVHADRHPRTVGAQLWYRRVRSGCCADSGTKNY